MRGFAARLPLPQLVKPKSNTKPLAIILYFYYYLNMETKNAASLLASLAQPTRLDVFRALVVAGQSGLAAGVLAEQLGVSAPVLSFHLKELRHAELIDSEQQGRFVIYRARYDTMNALLAFLTENCCAADPKSSVDACCPPVAIKETRRLSSSKSSERD
jgi:ArsR family transcriptional regulator, arsenate/arsenite/antimonite-responsive transcriptional repressor